MSDSLQRVVVWRNLGADGIDYCALWRTSGGWQLKGTAIAVLGENGPVLVHYKVQCDPAWRTHSVDVTLTHNGENHCLQLIVENAAKWRTVERPLPEVAGCVDADLAITPATNLLPIRRLEIPIGESREVIAAWVKFPELEIEPLAQRYTRLSADTYRYETGSDFCAQIVVDDVGLVISYQNAWQRIVSP
jgi:uncharacterized protein